MRTVRNIFSLNIWGHVLFWTWNIVFLSFILLGFAPLMLPQLVSAVYAGLVPFQFLAYGLVLTLIPVVAVLVGAIRLGNKPAHLFMLGYGVEWPLMLMLSIRFFVIRQATPAVIFLMVTAGLGMITLLWQLLDPHIDRRRPVLATIRLTGLSLLLVTGLYAAIWMAFYAIPLGGVGVNAVISILGNLPDIFRGLVERLRGMIVTDLTILPFALLGFLLIIYSATLFVLMPLAVIGIYCGAWWQAARSFFGGRVWAFGMTAGVLAVVVALFVVFNRQPQHIAFALLEKPPATLAEADALLDQQEVIRAGLLNSFLARQRYLSSVGEVRHVAEMYQGVFNMPDEPARQIQAVYEAIARPALYEPANTNSQPLSEADRWTNVALRDEPEQAAELYATFFDEPIVDGERTDVVRAARSTWSASQAEAAWQAIDDREVYLREQAVNVREQGDWAEVELFEVYENRTGQRQEVVYYFNLPESAVVTGVWLGDSPDRDQRYSYRVSPRGAAQAMYRNEVRRNIDPALVEQIGPRQYRLRIFPIEPRWMSWERERRFTPEVEDGTPLYMWLTYQVLAENGQWPLPRLAEHRNVFWDRHTQRQINGQAIEVEGEAWLPEAVVASAESEPVAHNFEFAGGEAVLARPMAAADIPSLPGGLNLAIVLDRSRSMARLSGAVTQALAELSAAGVSGDVYLTASEFRGEPPVVATLESVKGADVFYFGGQNAAELLTQFQQLYQGEPYDAVLVLTDGSGYELAGETAPLTIPNIPVWMVHLGEGVPLGYDDATLEVVQASGGGVSGSMAETLTRLAVSLSPQAGQADIVDGYVWETYPAGEAAIQNLAVVSHRQTGEEGFAPFAARRLILAEMRRYRGDLSQLETLDQLHEIAVTHSVVTPYSSMIVLVNRQQQQLLNQLESQGDRFQREYEEVGETMPENATITGVPEPEEWLLLALVVGLLGWLYWRKLPRFRLRLG
jgi:putative PEP-CTERM system integral membrane protein